MSLKPLLFLLTYGNFRDFEISGHVDLKMLTTKIVNVILDIKNAVKPYWRMVWSRVRFSGHGHGQSV